MQSVGCNCNLRFFRELPMSRTLQQLGDEPRVKRMTGLVGDQTTEHRTANESEVSDEVEHFVPHEFVRETERRIIQHAVFRQDNRIFKRTTANQPAGSQRFDFMVKTERARRRNEICEVRPAKLDLE